MADTYGFIARKLAAKVASGVITQADAEQALRLEPGEHLCANGVISGSGAHPEIPRHGADETDQDYPVPTGVWASLYRVADLMDEAGQ
jgi:hypothetical protein